MKRIGYVPLSTSMSGPGDRRRFVAYAKERQLSFEVASPNEHYDLVILSELCDISIWKSYRGGKIVYDLIDSYLAVRRTNLMQWMRGPVWYALGRYHRLQLDHWAAIKSMCCRADAVVCTTSEQQADIEPYCSNVHIILDVHSSIVRKPKNDWRCGTPFNLVWEGLPSNISQLHQVSGVLRTVNRRQPIVLNIITDSHHNRFLGRYCSVETLELAKNIFHEVRVHPWDENTWSEIVRTSDLAIIPIDLENPFVAGKPENKLILFWRMGLPVVASATQAYQRAMNYAGLSQFACHRNSDWITAIESLIGDENLRRDAANRGKVFAEQNYNTELLLRKWDAVFESIGFNFPKNSNYSGSR